LRDRRGSDRIRGHVVAIRVGRPEARVRHADHDPVVDRVARPAAGRSGPGLGPALPHHRPPFQRNALVRGGRRPGGGYGYAKAGRYYGGYGRGYGRSHYNRGYYGRGYYRPYYNRGWGGYYRPYYGGYRSYYRPYYYGGYYSYAAYYYYGYRSPYWYWY
jgi:hypothetical protein